MMRRPDWLFDRIDEWGTLVRFLDRRHPGLAIVRGRRRHGKSALLRGLSDASGALYHQAVRGVQDEQRRDLAETYRRHAGGPLPAFGSWSDALAALLRLDVPAVIIDELPYLTESAPELESVIQRALDERRTGSTGSPLILCGSARAVMTALLVGQAPLRGRAQVEMDVAAFDYRTAASFAGLPPDVAFPVHAVVGGVPGYMTDLLGGTYPTDPTQIMDWLLDVVASPHRPLIHEARSMVELEPGVRDVATYHSVLAAVTAGATRTGEIAGVLQRRTDAVAHSLRTLSALGLVSRSVDVLRDSRPTWRLTDELLRCYVALFRSRWSLVERRDRARLAQVIESPWRAQVLGPHLEDLARRWVRDHAADDTVGGLAVEVGAATVDDPARRLRHEVDVVALDDGGRVLALGEAKLRPVDADDLRRLVRIRQLLTDQGRASRDTRLLLVSVGGGAADLADRDMVVDLERLYHGD